jgi:hypothetical protein
MAWEWEQGTPICGARCAVCRIEALGLWGLGLGRALPHSGHPGHAEWRAGEHQAASRGDLEIPGVPHIAWL